MLTFKEVHEVYLDGKLIGNIKAEYLGSSYCPILSGYRYYPKGQKKQGGIIGERFDTLTACKNSLMT